MNHLKLLHWWTCVCVQWRKTEKYEFNFACIPLTLSSKSSFVFKITTHFLWLNQTCIAFPRGAYSFWVLQGKLVNNNSNIAEWFQSWDHKIWIFSVVCMVGIQWTLKDGGGLLQVDLKGKEILKYFWNWLSNVKKEIWKEFAIWWKLEGHSEVAKYLLEKGLPFIIIIIFFGDLVKGYNLFYSGC